MKLRETTRKIITALETKSGYLVQVAEDANLPVLATIKLARGVAPNSTNAISLWK